MSFISQISPGSSKAEREQALRDYKVTIEYKHLKQHAPGGVYLIPSMDDLRYFHGVIFVRRGPFTNGIFKFQIRLPEAYNDMNAWPQITFSSYVYNPHVNPDSGELDVKVAYPAWDPHKHYLVTVLTYLKKIFYMKSFGDEAVANKEARDLFRSNPKEYRKKVESCVRDSQKSVFVNDPGCTAKFTEDQGAHKVLRDMLKQKIQDPQQLTRKNILTLIDESNKQTESGEG
jgi:ubiquitin-protein ligase|eukprot:scaffold146222_cov44-Attheya_sp.AAC.2